jgi:4a-hydroxytetrahydrobiopterin dehydratase
MKLPEHCRPCRKGEPALDREQAVALHAHVPQWTLEPARLRRSFTLPDFRRALAWTNRVGMLAEEEGHHPDFHLTGWNRVELELWTHAVGGLSENDFVLARRIDELAARDGIG